MDINLLKPDYIFETSWEVCNKVGGIHTVVATKAQTLVKEFKDNLILIGPDVWRDSNKNPEFIEDNQLYSEWHAHATREGLRIRIGRWTTHGNPIAVLVDFSPFIEHKNEFFKDFWETYKLDSLSGHWDYIEASTFGYAAGKVIESFVKYNMGVREKVIAHFHEWMTGTGILYLKKYMPRVATLFTTHATVVGRSVAGNGQALYGNLNFLNGDGKAREFSVVAKHSSEKIAAQIADCFTTVSEITASECKQFLEKDVDIITPNGFEDDFVPESPDFDNRRKTAQIKLKQVSEALLGYGISDNAKYIGISGRYEFRNKGIDVFVEAMGDINRREDIDKEIIALILVPANNYGARKDLHDKLNLLNVEINRQDTNKYLTHGLHHAEYDAILNKIKQVGLYNSQEEKVKIIFVPSYLNSDDGIFDLKYYDLLIGLDLTVFPSYYEPWGYTPLESLAFHIPTITTNLAGFGQWITKSEEKIYSCMRVIERTDYNYQEVALNISEIISSCVKRSETEIEAIRNHAYKVSRTALWDNLIKYYLEAYHIALEKVEQRSEKITLDEPLTRVFHVEQKRSNKPHWRSVLVQPDLSGKFKGLEELSYNLWWSWNYDAVELWEELGGVDLWNECQNNPISLLKEVTFERFQELENDEYFLSKYTSVYTRFRKYMDDAKIARKPSIAYFCMEYGLIETLKIYSGGLGILAGDYLKEASDSNVDLVAVGLLYKYGYFNQQLSPAGEQMAQYLSQDFRRLPLTPVKDEHGNQLTIQIAFPGRILTAQVWTVMVGRVTLYLLDTDRKDNQEQDRSISYQLYGGDLLNRLKQEILLGVGGIRLLDALNIKKDIYHLNEGHAALINIERMRRLISERNFTFAEALEIVRSSSIFTTHTPVPAGHDAFPEDMVMTFMGHYPERLNISWQEFINLGKCDHNDKEEKFSMSYLAANLCQEINGVSWLHGDVTKEIFNKLWEGYFPEELHIGYVTNGVHYQTWADKEWQELYQKEFGKGFLEDQSNSDHWNKIQRVPDKKIWEIRQAKRKSLFDAIRSRMDSNWVRRREDPRMVMKVKNKLNENALTIGFARRFATYKRGNLLFLDLEHLAKIVNNPEMPVQFLFAGKAHPNDGGGQAIIKQVNEISRRPEFLGKILFLENYDMKLAQKLVSGVDIWLNTPTRPLEASGTSGMKAVMNGVLHFSVLDGWWVEGYREGAGWALDQKQAFDNHDFQNELDAHTIYRLLENQIIPTFYNRDKNGVPTEWVRYIKNSIGEIAPMFTTKRMIDDYIERFYTKLDKRHQEMEKNDYELAKRMASWKMKISRSWESIEVVSFNFFEIVKDPLFMGEKYFGELILNLHDLSDTNIGVEMIMTEIKPNGTIKIVEIREMSLMKVVKQKAHYAIEMVPFKPGNYNYGFRVFPKNELLPHRQDFSYVKWI